MVLERTDKLFIVVAFMEFGKFGKLNTGFTWDTNPVLRGQTYSLQYIRYHTSYRHPLFPPRANMTLVPLVDQLLYYILCHETVISIKALAHRLWTEIGTFNLKLF